ncbi:MAG: glutamate--cysteine ligase [Marinobacterium sp.]|nr:glutamate--cysteine ligase [Marinobacterium sp.]
MSAVLNDTVTWLQQSGHGDLLKGILHGIEKEGLRVDANGQLAQTDHPAALGSTLTHGSITTDYSEALLEFITPTFERSEDALGFLADLHRFTFSQLGEEELWCASMPCYLPDEDVIPIARYGSSNIGQMKYIYRVGLEHRYGKAMQAIAGIHYNFSVPESLWSPYQQYCGDTGSLQDFRSASYFKLIRNFRRDSWLLLYLFGASPALSRSFLQDKDHQLQTLDDETLYLPYATSLRMSDLGYSNKAQASLNICFNQLDTYAATLQEAIQTPYADYQKLGVKVDDQYRQLNDNVLQIENEYYSDIRPKRVTESGEKPVQALQARGVQYIEVRNTDINPFLPLGIDQQQADFMDLFLLSCLLRSDIELTDEECQLIMENHDKVVTRGREPGLTLHNLQGEYLLTDWAEHILQRCDAIAQLLDQGDKNGRYATAIAAQRDRIADPQLTPSARILATLQQENLSYDALILRESRRHRETLLATPLTAETAASLHEQAKVSLAQQREIEAADTVDFDAFLADYMAQQ